MISAEQLRALKKGNVSVDADKSRERIPEAFKSATKSQKDEIVNLTGLAVNTFYGVARSGAASPRVVLSLSQILDISPYYLTGEIDEKKHCDAADLITFFNKCGGGSITKKPAPAPKAVIEEPAPAPKAAQAEPLPAAITDFDAIDEESLILLLKALSVRAKYGGEAKQTYSRVVGLLVK